MIDITPATWVDGVSLINASTLNTEIRNSYLLLLNPPTCILHNTTAQSIPNGADTVWTSIAWDALVADTEAPADPMYSAGSNTRITCKTAGWYEAVINIGSAGTSNVVFGFSFLVNGTTRYAAGSNYGWTGVHRVCSAAVLMPLNATDFVQVQCQHTFTSAQSLEVQGAQPNFMLVRRRGI